MSTKIIKKALEELNKDNPRLDYVRGMLEVIAEEDETEHYFGSSLNENNIVPIVDNIKSSNLLVQDKKIQELISGLGFNNMLNTIEENVKSLTGIEMKPENFTEIINKLEQVKDKVKVVDATEAGGTTITSQDVKTKSK